jgi:hypothetical protein
VGNQRVDQRSGLISGCRVHHQALGLVDDDEVLVLVDDRQRDVLGKGFGGLIRWDCQLNCVASVDAVARIADRAPIDC